MNVVAAERLLGLQNHAVEYAGTVYGDNAAYEASVLLEDILEEAQDAGDSERVSAIYRFNRFARINAW